MKEQYDTGGTPPRIIIDADACPRRVFEICRVLAREFGRCLVTVASVNHAIDSDWHITVDPDPEAADMHIVNLACAQDVVITADWGLASMVLAKGATCLSPSGKRYRDADMGAMLEVRAAQARHRRGGGRTRGPSPRSSEDDIRFERALRTVLAPGAGGNDGMRTR